FLLSSPYFEKKLEMDEEYQGNVEVTGEDYSAQPIESKGISSLF
ncbi:hypothetical protein M8C21_018435, partial [Ambrosia artemisiifolia]